MEKSPYLLTLEQVSVQFCTQGSTTEVLHNLSLQVFPGEIFAIVGESGSGKTVLCKTIVGLLPRSGKQTSGTIKFSGEQVAMIFQNPMTSLNPTIKIGKQIGEAVKMKNPDLSNKEVKKHVFKLMKLVGLSQVEINYNAYPYQFSGGMKQRCVLAIALATNPKLLIADEPTTALDTTIQAEMLELFIKIKQELGTTILFITHDLGVVASVADRVAVMKNGQIEEINSVETIFYHPQSAYTKELLESATCYNSQLKQNQVHNFWQEGNSIITSNLINNGKKIIEKDNLYTDENNAVSAKIIDFQKNELNKLAENLKDNQFQSSLKLMITNKFSKAVKQIKTTVFTPDSMVTTNQHSVVTLTNHLEFKQPALKLSPNEPKSQPVPLLQVTDLSHTFKISRKIKVPAVRHVSFDIQQGELFGIIGESGSGKTTLGKCLLGIYQPTSGKASYFGETIKPRIVQSHIQGVFQDSTSSLNPRMTVRQIIEEPLAIKGWYHQSKAREKFIKEQLVRVQLTDNILDKYPYELSGGQRQRVNIARGICTNPKLLIADEPIASLDISTQVKISQLFQHLQKEHGLSVLFISHDLAMVGAISDRVAVMYQGQIVEIGPTAEIYQNPQHSYTKSLLSAMLIPDPKLERQRKRIEFNRNQVTASELFVNSDLPIYEKVTATHFVLKEES